jgi:hypothetical protein
MNRSSFVATISITNLSIPVTKESLTHEIYTAESWSKFALGL